MLALEDLKSCTEDEVCKHLAAEYGVRNYNDSYDSQIDPKVLEALEPLEILIAYESVGDYGCDSSSYFLFRNKETKELFETNGSHCSCNGFEDQFGLEPVDIINLAHESKNDYGIFYPGGYDGNKDENMKLVKEEISKLK